MRRKNIRTRINRILPIPKPYIEAVEQGIPIFNPLFQFENALRLALDKHMQTCYGENWWDEKVQKDLPNTYKYADNVKQNAYKMPWIGATNRVPTLPLHSITLGQLEEIIIHYKSECFPQLFSSEAFFTGHMEIIKKVRNLFSHMHPCIGKKDVKAAKREITTLCDHLRTKI
jgi:hypothetical protein